MKQDSNKTILNTPKIPSQTEVLIIGGGIVGAGIFRDLSKHRIPTLLVDKGDFSSQTSQRSSKMLHGGIRYLENMDFGLVKEALHEKNLWLKLVPHLAYEVPFYLPTYKDSLRNLFMIRCGLMLYDFLSGFKNSPFKILSKKQAHVECPHIRKDGLKGCGVYYDGIVHDAKLTLECIYDGMKSPKSQVANYFELQNVEKNNGQYKVQLKDNLTHELHHVECRSLVFATGPFTDKILSKFDIYDWKDRMLPSKGSHIWISKKRFPLKRPVVLTPNDGRVIFVIPHHHKILVGTTEVPVEGEMFNIEPSQKEIDYLLDNLNDFFPQLSFESSDVLSAFAGVRPLVKEDGNNLGKTAREHKIIRPDDNTYVIIGGKYTTFRVMGQDITREICDKYQVAYNPSACESPPTQSSIALPYQEQKLELKDLVQIVRNEYPRTLEDVLERRIGITYKEEWSQYFDQDHDKTWSQFLEKVADLP